MIGIIIWLTAVGTYAFLRTTNVIGEPTILEPVSGIETDYELFRKESIRNGFSFDGIHSENNEFYIRSGINESNILSMKKVISLIDGKEVRKGEILLNNELKYTIDLN